MKDKLMAVALLAGLEYTEVHKLPNAYWPNSPDPWLLFVCDGGTVTMGWRKRVLHVEWTIGDADAIEDEDLKWISHASRFFHAWDWIQAVRFLSRVVDQLKQVAAE